MKTIKEKFDEKITFTMTRRQAYKVLCEVGKQAHEWNTLEALIKNAMGISDIHHESEDGEED